MFFIQFFREISVLIFGKLKFMKTWSFSYCSVWTIFYEINFPPWFISLNFHQKIAIVLFWSYDIFVKSSSYGMDGKLQVYFQRSFFRQTNFMEERKIHCRNRRNLSWNQFALLLSSYSDQKVNLTEFLS